MAFQTAFDFVVFLWLMAIALVWFALALFTPGWLARVRRAWADWSGILIILVGLSVIGLGMATFIRGQTLSLRSVALAAYDTAQLFTLNIDESKLNGKDNPLGWLAAASAALFAVLFAFGVIAALFRDSLATFRLLIARRHVVVCGVGRTGRRIIEDLHRRDARQLIVAIDVTPQISEDLSLYTRGVITLIGSATKEEVLRKAGVSRAAEVFVATGTDEQNIECAMAIADLSRPLRGSLWGGIWDGFRRYKTRCFVHVVNRDLAEIFRAKSDDMEKYLPGIDIEVFSAAERTALKLLETMTQAAPLPEVGQVAHVVLIGFGKFGQSLALHLAELAHFPNHQRLRLTIADRGIRETARPFLARYFRFCRNKEVLRADSDEAWTFSPADDEWACATGSLSSPDAAGSRVIDWVCNASFVEVDDPCDEAFVRRLSAAFADSHVWPAVIVAYDDDRRNFTAAERLKEIRDRLGGVDAKRWPLFAWISGRQELARLLNHQPDAAGVRPFGSFDDDAYYSDIADAWTEQLAYLMNYAYEKPERLAELNAPTPTQPGATVQRTNAWKQFKHDSLVQWQAKPAVMKPSNRSAAAHGVIKLAMLGWQIHKGGGGAAPELGIDERRMETLARMEHYRWVSERLLAGWAFGESNDMRKTRPHFVPYEDLQEKARGNDRNVVRTLAAFCRFGKVILKRLAFNHQSRSGAEVGLGPLLPPSVDGGDVRVNETGRRD